MSLAETSKVTTAPLGPVHCATTCVGAKMMGGVVSVTLTVNSQRALFCKLSTATQVTVVAPGGNAVPEGGVHVTVTRRPHVLVAVTVKLTTVPFGPTHSVTMFVGQLMVTQGPVVCAGAWNAASNIAVKT
jgi:hypothetical protein